ncbi:MAG: GNAT family N-acetyltransferase [Gammaproteobacteria bacterium]|nr:GNAT family N-acetyltransferase [Gammaproteobacteria bacterium]
MQIEVKRITRSDDLAALVDLINTADWDEDNDVDPYSAAALDAYLAKEDTVFVAAFSTIGKTQLVGMASGRIELKPYDHMKWLYIDEVDTCASHRRKGVGRALMKYLLEMAREAACEEVWLGTESTNVAANALYKSLSPNEVDEVVGYLFEFD